MGMTCGKDPGLELNPVLLALIHGVHTLPGELLETLLPINQTEAKK